MRRGGGAERDPLGIADGFPLSSARRRETPLHVKPGSFDKLGMKEILGGTKKISSS